MSTLILSPRYSEDSRVMRAAAIRAGWNVVRLTNWRVPDDTAATAIYGETMFAEVIAAQLGITLLDDWLPNLPKSLLQRKIQISTLGEARRHTDPVFVKPADGRKGFAGAVYRNGIGLPSPQACPDDTLVLMAEPVEWRSEFRCFVKDGAVLTMSPYLRNGDPARAEDGSWPTTPSEVAAVQALIEKLAAEVPVPPSIVIDVGLIEGRGWAIVEANCAFGAGVYGCDPHKVLAVLERGCVPTVELTASDASWARPAAQLE
ncbi:ATP-grasp domain-containing protein [Nocardia rosealba]|uniref:ATP-grasp domain-containing protein n=1 Tax=Nocardia rosealba TaxID=2878563 RepID=UPI001CD9D078|nr:ATP-grasp domain-containing protein [Nocardia rosealba]MCA2205743.1 ATP-grasp domain-containing protein [Nocardia rosealba]